jgi:hypothetical protein
MRARARGNAAVGKEDRGPGAGSDSSDSDFEDGVPRRATGQRRFPGGKTMDGFALDFQYGLVAPALIVAGLCCILAAHYLSSFLGSLLG